MPTKKHRISPESDGFSITRRSVETNQPGKPMLAITYDDWQRLERERVIHQVVYAGGSVACALLLKKSGSLQRFMQFFPTVPRLGWPAAFEKHFKTTLDGFYGEFDKFARAAAGQLDARRSKGSWCSFLKAIE